MASTNVDHPISFLNNTTYMIEKEGFFDDDV
jgi:hypothetical protein